MWSVRSRRLEDLALMRGVELIVPRYPLLPNSAAKQNDKYFCDIVTA